MANYKRRRAKQRNSGCLFCKPHKASFNKTAARMKEAPAHVAEQMSL